MTQRFGGEVGVDSGDLHNCGNTTEATTLLQQFIKKNEKKLGILSHTMHPGRVGRGPYPPTASLSLSDDGRTR